jgi:hypothetical protein
LRKSVITGDSLTIGRQHKTDGNVLCDILASLPLQVIAQRFTATEKSRSVMRFSERLDFEVVP